MTIANENTSDFVLAGSPFRKTSGAVHWRVCPLLSEVIEIELGSRLIMLEEPKPVIRAFPELSTTIFGCATAS